MDVTDSQVQSLFNQGFTAPNMAECLGCSVSYVYSRLYEMGLKLRDRYADVTDADLNHHVSELQSQSPNCGVEVKKKSMNSATHKCIIFLFLSVCRLLIE